MTCPDCSAAEQTKGHWRQYNSPGCLYCTARLHQQIGELYSPTSAAIAARRRVVLVDAVAWGHDEQEILKLASKKELVFQPPEVKRK